MLGIAAIMAAVKWNEPQFRSPDITSPFAAVGLFTLFIAIPLVFHVPVLAVTMALVDQRLQGRLSLAGNAVIGGLLGALDALGFLWVGQVVPDNNTPMNATTIAVFVPILAVGGVIVSLGMRRRPAASSQ
jgi:hypothetical protein